jgi:hypothetical protein
LTEFLLANRDSESPDQHLPARTPPGTDAKQRLILVVVSEGAEDFIVVVKPMEPANPITEYYGSSIAKNIQEILAARLDEPDVLSRVVQLLDIL